MTADASAPSVAVLLAAGGGTRFIGDGHKLLASLPASTTRPAETVFTRSLATVTAAGFDTVVVVTGRMDSERLGLASAVDDGSTINIVHNDRWGDGQATSVAAGIDAAERLGATIVTIGLADQPGIDASAWRAVGDAIDHRHQIAVATYAGRRANPVAIERRLWPVLPTSGDRGARVVMGLHPDLVVEVPCSGSPDDIDTAEDLRRWQNS